MNSLMIVRVIQLKIQLTWKSWKFNLITGVSTGCGHLLPRLVAICPLASRQDKSMAVDGQVQTGRTRPDLSQCPASFAATPWPSFSFPSSSILKGGKGTHTATNAQVTETLEVSTSLKNCAATDKQRLSTPGLFGKKGKIGVINFRDMMLQLSK
jgi:hypothetical protein